MTNNNNSVQRSALITGASRGIGAAVAQKLASDGLYVVLNFVNNRDAAERTLSSIKEAGGKGELCQFDVSDGDAVSQGLESLRGRHIDVLVNNAGITKDVPFPAMEREAWGEVMRTTLDGFYNVTQPLVMPMVRAKFGRIVNMSSVSGLIGNRGQVNYSAAKAGIIGATKALAQEMAKRKVTVNAVAPGLIDTDMVQGAPVEELLKHIPMRRLGRADEVAELVSFLCSDRAAYITGQVIGISGGLA